MKRLSALLYPKASIFIINVSDKIDQYFKSRFVDITLLVANKTHNYTEQQQHMWHPLSVRAAE